MDLRDLAYFEAIAELGHLGRAAERLGRTKPALTKCVHRLEAAVGARLFRRDGRGISITPIGELLLAQARRLRAASEEALRDVGDFVRGEAGQVRIGVGPTVGEFIMPDICAAMLKQLPSVQIELMTGLGDVVRKALQDDRLDLIVSTVLPNDEDSFDVDIISADSVVVVASIGHELCGRTVMIEELRGYDWVLSSPTAATRQWLDGAFALRNQPSPKVRIETNAIQVLPTLIERTGLLGFLPTRYLRPAQEASSLRQIDCEATKMRRQIGVLRRKGNYLSPAVSRVIELLRTHHLDDATF